MASITVKDLPYDCVRAMSEFLPHRIEAAAVCVDWFRAIVPTFNPTEFASLMIYYHNTAIINVVLDRAEKHPDWAMVVADRDTLIDARELFKDRTPKYMIITDYQEQLTAFDSLIQARGITDSPDENQHPIKYVKNVSRFDIASIILPDSVEQLMCLAYDPEFIHGRSLRTVTFNLINSTGMYLSAPITTVYCYNSNFKMKTNRCTTDINLYRSTVHYNDVYIKNLSLYESSYHNNYCLEVDNVILIESHVDYRRGDLLFITSSAFIRGMKDKHGKYVSMAEITNVPPKCTFIEV